MGLTGTAPDHLPVTARRPGLGEALRFSWSWQRSELTELRCARPRPIGILMAEAAAILPVIVFLSNPQSAWWLLVIAAATGAGAGLLIALMADAHGYRRSCWHNHHRAAGERGGAFVRAHGGRASLQCVHAVPRGKGLGSEMMAEVCTWADRNGQTLELKASGEDAARFYRRFGFTATHGRHMTRICQLY